MKKLIKTMVITTVIVAVCSCSKETVDPANNGSTTGGNLTQNVEGKVDTATLAAARRLTVALNNGNANAALQSFSTTAAFNSVGRIYNGRDDIMNRFLIPEVININGKYTELKVTADTANVNIITIEYNFGNGSFSEHFTYQYTIQNGIITYVLGKYI